MIAEVATSESDEDDDDRVEGRILMATLCRGMM